MTVTTTGSPNFEAFPSGSDPRLPQGEWFGRVQVAGDATGGFAIAKIQFFGSSHVSTGQVFSLVDVYVTTGAGAAVSPVAIQAGGWDYGGVTATNLSRVIGNIQLTAYAGSTSLSGFLRDSAAAHPVFLGSPVDGAEAQVQAFFENTNGVSHQIFASGKWWTPEARYLAGGPVEEGSVSAPLPPELQGSSYYALLRAGLIGQYNVEMLRAARISEFTRSTAPATPVLRRATATGKAQSASSAPQSNYERQQEVGRALAARFQIASSIRNEGRLRVTPNISTRDVQLGTGESTAISALVANAAGGKGISVRQYQAFNRASEILSDPRFARTES